MTDSRPTKKQRELLSFIDSFIKGNGYGPSYREVMRALDYKSVSTVAAHIDGLIVKGYLAKRDHSARSLEVVGMSGATPTPQANAAKQPSLTERFIERFDQIAQSEEVDTKQLRTLVEALDILGETETHQQLQARLDNFDK